MIQDYWNAMSTKDKRTLTIGGVLAIIMLIYAFIYSPLQTSIHELRQQVLDKKETLLWMQSVRSELETTKHKSKPIAHNKLLSLVNNDLQQRNFKAFPSRLQMGSTNDVQVNFERVPVNMLLEWVWRLNTRYSVAIKQFDLQRSNTQGVVKASIRLNASTSQ